MSAFRLPSWLWLVVNGLSVYRLTRLVTLDTITEGARGWVHRRLGRGAFDFSTCPWCVSIWLAAGVVVATAIYPGGWRFVAIVLACSAVAGFLAEH